MNFEVLWKILKESRIKVGYTQDEIAVYLNVTPQNISSWERGKSKIDIQNLETLCMKYNVDLKPILQQASGYKKEPLMKTTGAQKIQKDMKIDYKF